MTMEIQMIHMRRKTRRKIVTGVEVYGYRRKMNAHPEPQAIGVTSELVARLCY
jgi:hypothetical protein